MDEQSCGEALQQRCDDHTCFLVESPFTDACTHLQNMPEDCLLEILSVESFDLMDFCSLAETCKLFRSITQRVIGKIPYFDGKDENFVFQFAKFRYFTSKRNDVERIFRNFGSCLSKVSIGSAEYRQECCFILNLVKSHCDEGLKHLEIRNNKIFAILAEDLKPVFRRLQTFKLFDVCIERNNSLFRDLNSLVELQLECVENCSSIFHITFPQLELFTYKTYHRIPGSNNPNEPSMETLSAFITRHTALKSLTIHLICDQSDWMIILQAIGNNCTELQEFDIGFLIKQKCLPTLLIPLQSLKSLRTVSLLDETFEDFKAFAPLTQLRKLHLENCLLPRDIDEFAHLAQLTKLSMETCKSISTYDITYIISHLINLVKLELVGLVFDQMEFALNETTFLQIVGILEGRSNILKLICRCDSTVRSTRIRTQRVNLIFYT